MRYGRITILIYLLTSYINLATAQQQIFKNYSVNDGLISNAVRRVFQDKQGFLWIATWEGFSKYDGYTFTNYSTANGLSHNLVNDFYESADKQLYVALNNGNIDIITDNTITPKAVLPTAIVNRFINAPGHPIIVITDHKGMFELEDKKLIHPKQPYPFESYSNLTWLNDSVFVAASENSIGAYNTNFELITEIRDSSLKFSYTKIIHKIIQDSKKRIWIGTTTGLFLLNYYPQKDHPLTFATLPEPFNFPELNKAIINDMLEDKDGIIWIATNGGLIKLNPDGSYQLVTVKEGLPSNIITSIFQDKEKNIWFGTAVGLSKLVTASGIRLYALENGAAASDYLYLLYPYKKNHLLVSTQTGVQDFDKLSGKFTAIGSKGTPAFYSLVANMQPPLFVGMDEMARLDTNTLHFNEIEPLPIKLAVRIVRDRAGNLFVSNSSQLLFSVGNKNQLILDYRISSLLIDKEGELWAGTWQNGLFHIRYRTENSALQIISKEHLLPDENIRCLLEDSKGAIWVGTRYNGIYRLVKTDTDNTAIIHINQSKGLSSDFIKVIKEDAKGNYWIAFYQGLDKLIPSGSDFHIFNYSRIYNYFTSVVGMEVDADNTLWLATGEGLAHISDGEMEKLPPLPVYITKVFSPDTSYQVQTKNLELDYKQNQLQFEFSAPGYINEKQLMYSYRLDGSSNPNWSSAGNQHNVSYASLQPGNYTFEVRTLGWNNQWGQPAIFRFVINPPFWKTGWFIFLITAAALFIIYYFIKWRIKNIKEVASEKLKVQQLNAEQFRNKLEMEQIVNYFSSSLISKNTVDDVLWDVAKNLIGRLGFEDCMMYLWNEDKTKMIQRAGYGPKGSIEEIANHHFDACAGQGVVGYVMQTKEAVLIRDKSQDTRYRMDDMIRLSEITVPIIYNGELIGVIDSEHHQKNFYTQQHIQLMSTIATLTANKIKSIEAEQLLQQTKIEMLGINEKLTEARLDTLRSQLNPHFIFNCLNAIDNLIQTNQSDKATTYLARFAKLIRSILENSKANTVPCWKDIETLKLYLELEALRFDHQFSYQVTMDEAIANGDYKVPPLIIQPFVENAIHHGLLNKFEPDKKLTVSVSLTANCIHYEVTDNGVGRVQAAAYKQLNKPAYESMGMQITADRISLFNQHKNGFVKVTDLYDDNQNAIGTKVEIDLIIQP